MSSGDNPFTEALHSEALGEMLKDETKRGLAKQLTENLKKLSEMFVKLSDGEKSQFAKEFKGQFLNQLKNLNEMAQQQKVSQENGEAQKSIPEFGAADAFQEEVDSFLVIGFGMLIMLFVGSLLLTRQKHNFLTYTISLKFSSILRLQVVPFADWEGT